MGFVHSQTFVTTAKLQKVCKASFGVYETNHQASNKTGANTGAVHAGNLQLNLLTEPPLRSEQEHDEQVHHDFTNCR